MIVPNSSGTSLPRAESPADACDCHIHIYDPRFPMTRPTLKTVPNASVADYRLLQKRLGTTRTVVVQPAAYGIDNAVTLDAIAELGVGRTRGIAVVHPTVTDTELVAMNKAGVRGLRFTLHDARTAVTSADMIEPLAIRVNRIGWHVQLHLLAEQIVEMRIFHAGRERLLDRAPPPGQRAHLGEALRRLPQHPLRSPALRRREADRARLHRARSRALRMGKRLAAPDRAAHEAR